MLIFMFLSRNRIPFWGFEYKTITLSVFVAFNRIKQAIFNTYCITFYPIYEKKHTTLKMWCAYIESSLIFWQNSCIFWQTMLKYRCWRNPTGYWASSRAVSHLFILLISAGIGGGFMGNEYIIYFMIVLLLLVITIKK